MKRVEVDCQVNYTFQIDIPDDEDDVVSYCDMEDPVYQDIVKILREKRMDYEGQISNIIDVDTDEILYRNFN